MNAKPICCIVGVGPGNGAAFVRKYTKENYHVAMLARDHEYLSKLEKQIPDAKGFVLDATSVEQSKNIYSQIKEQLGPIETLIYNAGSRDFNNIANTTEQEFEQAWRVNTYGCFLAMKFSIAQMLENNQGNIVIIGATASWRGAEDFASFSSSKAAQRSLAQSAAKYLGPKGIHVCYVIIDAIIDRPAIRKRMPDQPDDFFIQADDIADSVYFLTQQPKSSWTFELDLRPYKEPWH